MSSVNILGLIMNDLELRTLPVKNSYLQVGKNFKNNKWNEKLFWQSIKKNDVRQFNISEFFFILKLTETQANC